MLQVTVFTFRRFWQAVVFAIRPKRRGGLRRLTVAFGKSRHGATVANWLFVTRQAKARLIPPRICVCRRHRPRASRCRCAPHDNSKASPAVFMQDNTLIAVVEFSLSSWLVTELAGNR
jgi:hypothetical protein